MRLTHGTKVRFVCRFGSFKLKQGQFNELFPSEVKKFCYKANNAAYVHSKKEKVGQFQFNCYMETVRLLPSLGVHI